MDLKDLHFCRVCNLVHWTNEESEERYKEEGPYPCDALCADEHGPTVMPGTLLEGDMWAKYLASFHPQPKD